ncbi:autotransporter protein [Yersinia frederiksenii]|uniref:Autotransporter protein n=2 Tax=Yersinia frederiksenii TaxID=29484 RepID=A0A380PQI8_YERFR|nr:autotransporter outer membrane beta-barrel domain-containing protein [Yersinia frederiksenii]ATM95569.1 type V secretion protein A [Yersinia frederiksenii]SUP75818.1 autotransporter protein [Yersinia frederiksenii]
MNKNPNPINRSATVGCGAQLIRQYPRGNLSVLALLIFGILGSPCASAAFTPEVIGEEVTGETLESGETQNVREGGTANDTTINGGEQSVNDGGIANDTTINGGPQFVEDGGIANDTTINGSSQYVYGGIANNTTINNYGRQDVRYDGIANDTTINNDGSQSVEDGGIANNTTINDYGRQGVYNGGIANDTTINNRGWQKVYSNAIANNTTINHNGLLEVDAGGTLTGQTIVNDRGTMRAYEGVIHNEGEVIFQRSDDYTLNFDLTGTGGLTQNGPHTLTLSTASSYSGATSVNGGIIKAGADNVFSASSDYITQAGGALDLDGYHQTLQSLNHGGTVNFGGLGGNTLTITGDYSGNNGLLNMNSVLEDDDSVTDKLIIGGNTAGNTFVQVNNLGGSGAQTLNGIELITVGGVSEGEFTQQGRIVAGAYDYYLERGVGSNNANWYLSNAIPTETPEVPGEPSPPLVERPEASGYSANLAAANNLFVTRLHDRLGETHYIDALTGEQKVTSLWLRNEGGHNRSRDSQDQLRTKSNRYVMQLGGDIAQWSHTGADRFHLGLMAGYGNSKSTSESRLSGYSARASVDGYSTGVYGTWYANSADKTGLYVDSWAQYSWFDNTVNGQGLAAEEYKSKGVTASVESGYTFKIGENAAKNATYFIQPKAQVTWMGVKADEHKEANGTNVSGEGNGNIQTRLGVKAFMNGYAEQDKGKDRVFQPFVEANWIHNTKDFGTTLDGITVKQAGAANIAELKLGVEGQLSKKVNLWGNVGQQVGNKGYSDTAVMLGVKYNF